MRPDLVLLLALGVLLLPPGAGLLLAAAGGALWLARGGDRLLPVALLLLACAPLLPGWRAALLGPPPAEREGAVRLCGHWRQPPGSDGFLATAGGDLPLRFAAGVQPPAPGTPVVVAARVSPGSAPLAVSVVASGAPEGAWLDRWAVAAAARVGHLVSRDNEGLVAALVLGQRKDLHFTVRANCTATGTNHVLALAGLHVALIAASLQRLGAGRSPLLVLGVLSAFTLLAGATAPLRRSSLGFALVFAGRGSARQPPAFHRLLAVGLLLLVWQPGLQRELSAQLSFLGVAGLIFASRLVRGPLSTLVGPCGAFLATAPICVETFGRVAPIGVLLTPLLIPVLGVILGVGLIAVLPCALLAALDPVCGPVLDGAASLMRWMLEQFVRFGPAPLRPAPPPVPGWLLGLLIVAALAVLASRRRRTDGPLAERAT